MVSFPEKWVHRSVSMSRSASPGSNRSMVTSVATCWRAARTESVLPATWKNGRTLWNRSPVRRPMRRPEKNASAHIPRWVSNTPFGYAVVPDVYWMRSTSSGVHDGSVGSVPWARKSDHDRPAAGTSSPRTTTARRSGMPGSGSAESTAGQTALSIAMKSIFRKRSATKSMDARDCRRAWASSPAWKRVLTGTVTAPSDPIARNRVIHSGPLPRQTAMWSPRRTPAAARAERTRSTSAARVA
ncbi:hypothetical protein LUX39_50395 [Actinomadura madurae]|nr:hypothetical protein [Actinomadura madurae]